MVKTVSGLVLFAVSPLMGPAHPTLSPTLSMTPSLILAPTLLTPQLQTVSPVVSPSPVPQDEPGSLVPKRKLPLEGRAKPSRKLQKELDADHERGVQDATDPSYIRFSMPLANAYFQRIVTGLLAASGLDASKEGIFPYLQDTTWGGPSAKMGAGVLYMEPEAIAIMATEDEVAAVVAHELAHHLLGHAAELAGLRKWNPFKKSGGEDMFSSGPEMSRKEQEMRWRHEYEADALSLLILDNAGYDPSAAADALLSVKRARDTDSRYAFERGRYDPSHPAVEQRLAYMAKVVEHYGLKAGPRRKEGLAEVYEELKNRHRAEYPDTKASDIYDHYKRD